MSSNRWEVSPVACGLAIALVILFMTAGSMLAQTQAPRQLRQMRRQQAQGLLRLPLQVSEGRRRTVQQQLQEQGIAELVDAETDLRIRPPQRQQRGPRMRTMLLSFLTSP